MKYIFLFLIISLLFSCKQKPKAQLEINFTSWNKTNYSELKLFNLTKVPIIYSAHESENMTFRNVHCVSPNKFIFKSIDTGNYIGLLQIEKDGALFSVDIYPLHLNPGQNILTKELNLGEVSLPPNK